LHYEHVSISEGAFLNIWRVNSDDARNDNVPFFYTEWCHSSHIVF